MASKKNKKRVLHIKIGRKGSPLVYEVHEITVHIRLFILLMLFTVSGILVGRSLYEYGINFIGLNYTALGGVVIFILSGLGLKRFHR